MIRRHIPSLILTIVFLTSCHDKVWSDTPKAITWNDSVADIVHRRCSTCHAANPITAPFPLISHHHVVKRAEQILQVTNSGYMPPWLPHESDHAFLNDRSLTDTEKQQLHAWLTSGSPLETASVGQNETAGPRETSAEKSPQTSPSTSTWLLGKPDLILNLKQAFQLRADGKELFWNFVLPIPVSGKKYVEAVEVQPGNSAAVHHIVGLIDRTGSARRRNASGAGQGFEGMEFGVAEIPTSPSILWSPGKAPTPPTRGLSWPVDSQTDVVLQMHLFPTGKPERIAPQLGLYFADQPPTRHAVSIMLEAADIDIPAGAADYAVDARITLPVEVQLLSVYPHAHYLGKAIECTATLPDGTETTLLNIPDWDFNWQDEYQFQSPPTLPAGTTVRMRWTYDNSADNVRNPNSPPERVQLGNSSTDEMGSLMLQVLCKSADDQAKLDESRWLQKLEAMPRNTTANQNLGNLYESRGEYEKARRHYRTVVSVTPRDSIAHDNLACAYAALGDEKMAEHHFQRAITFDPDNALARNNWGDFLMRTNRPDEAVRELQRSVEIWPEFPEARVNLGKAELQRGNVKQAILNFRTAIEQNPEYALAYFNLATVYMGQTRFAEAETTFRRALQADPEFAEACNNLGIVLFQQNKFAEAETQFRRAIEIAPDYVNPRRNLQILQQQMATKPEDGESP